MNREIKFRGWNKSTNTMVDLHAITPLALSSSIMQDGVFLPFHEDIVLMQCVGLKDKNGIEIYEGDILSDGCEAAAVLWWKADLTFVLHYQDFIDDEDDEPGSEVDIDALGWTGLKVIGNIFQNPELLEA